MKVARAYSVVPVHSCKLLMSKKHCSRESRLALKKRCGQLQQLHLQHHFVDTTPALFSNAKPAHQRCKRPIAESGQIYQH